MRVAKTISYDPELFDKIEQHRTRFYPEMSFSEYDRMLHVRQLDLHFAMKSAVERQHETPPDPVEAHDGNQNPLIG